VAIERAAMEPLAMEGVGIEPHLGVRQSERKARGKREESERKARGKREESERKARGKREESE
jgi:hypothetical protein